MENWKIALIVVLVIIILVIIIVAIGLTYKPQEYCKLDSPKNVVGLTMDYGKVRMSWDEVPGATHYCIYLSSQPNVDPNSYEEKIVTSTIPYIWEKQEAGTYFFAVTAKRSFCPSQKGPCGECESDPCQIATAIFNCELPEAPVINDESGVVSNTIYIAWFPSQNQDVTEYMIYFKQQNGEPISTQSYDTKISVQHPTWFYVYEIPISWTNPVDVIVTACNDCGESPPSEPYTASGYII